MSGVNNSNKGKTVACVRSVSRGLKFSLIFGGMLLAGCESYQRDHFTVGSVPSDYRTKHPIVVSQSEVSEDLVISNTMRGMNFRQENVVTDFLSRFRRSKARSVRILVPSGSANEAAARRVANDVVKHMRKTGVEADRIRLSSYHASEHGDAATLRLSFEAVTADVAGKCGTWEEDLIDTSENVNYGNFGCATQNNLAKIIANPEDLLGPRGESEIDATRRNTIVDDWRQNGSPALPSLL